MKRYLAIIFVLLSSVLLNCNAMELIIRHDEDVTQIEYELKKIHLIDNSDALRLKLILKAKKNIDIEFFFSKSATYSFSFDENLTVDSFGEMIDINVENDEEIMRLYHATISFDSIKDMFEKLGSIMSVHKIGINSLFIPQNQQD